MNGAIYSLTSAQLETFYIDEIPADSWEALLQFAQGTQNLFVGIYQGHLLGVIGVMDLVPGEGYVWFQTTEESSRHKLVLIRHSQAFIRRMLEFYPKLTGHCLEPLALPWLKSLGAQFKPGQDGSIFFEIGA